MQVMSIEDFNELEKPRVQKKFQDFTVKNLLKEFL